MSDLHILYDGALIIENGIITKIGKTEEVLSGIDLSH
jgi:cytosine/adenosine deaminase-related metal-dependent hydrolase